MCGIVGYVGKRNAQDVLLDGLEKLEYRGYDSAGVALALEGGIRVVKSKGRLAELRKRLAVEALARSLEALGVSGEGWGLVFAAMPQLDNYKDCARRMQLDSIAPEASIMDIDLVDPYNTLFFSICY